MDNWWQDPRLDDEGTYDYLIEELPKDYAKWELSKYRWRCDNCGKERHLRFVSAHHFYCWDGWDSMGYAECWKCRLKSRLRYIKWKAQKNIKQSIKTFKLTRELYEMGKKSFKDCYKLAKKLER